MSLSLYDVSIPVFIRALNNLSAILDKAAAFADEKDVPHTDLLEARLFDDMAPFTTQVQRASDASRFTAARVGQIEMAPIEDNETSFADLKARISVTVAALKAVPENSMDGREKADIELKTPNGSMHFSGRDYVLGFSLPNFFFHVTTAYDLLRHKGVPIGKMDFLGRA